MTGAYRIWLVSFKLLYDKLIDLSLLSLRLYMYMYTCAHVHVFHFTKVCTTQTVYDIYRWPLMPRIHVRGSRLRPGWLFTDLRYM